MICSTARLWESEGERGRARDRDRERERERERGTPGLTKCDEDVTDRKAGYFEPL